MTPRTRVSELLKVKPAARPFGTRTDKTHVFAKIYSQPIGQLKAQASKQFSLRVTIYLPGEEERRLPTGRENDTGDLKSEVGVGVSRVGNGEEST